jgi:hypothetical protein
VEKEILDSIEEDPAGILRIAVAEHIKHRCLNSLCTCTDCS